MSLIEELAQSGISAEDLEKAASVRLFEKVATENGIDFNDLSEDDINGLYAHFVEQILPQMMSEGGEGQEAQEPQVKESSAPNEGLDPEKVASFLMFEKVAEEEDINLTELNEDELNGLYGYFLENVLPGMLEEREAKQASAGDVEEAQAKLAEVEILGRHMAASFRDELNKEAQEEGEEDKPKGMSGKKKALLAGGALAGTAAAGVGAKKGIEALGRRSAAKGVWGALQKKGSAPSELFEKLATERAMNILEANGINPETGEKQTESAEEPDFESIVTARAIEMLEANGYQFEE